MICNACGTLLSDVSRFCINCGESVGSRELKNEPEPIDEAEDRNALLVLLRKDAENLIQRFAKAGVTIEINSPAWHSERDKSAVSQADYTVFLHAVGWNKLEVLNIVHEVTAVPLSNARNLIEVVPIIVKEGLTRSEAETICQRLMEVGAIAEVEPSAPKVTLPPLKSKLLLGQSSDSGKSRETPSSGCTGVLLLLLGIFVYWSVGLKADRAEVRGGTGALEIRVNKE